MAFVVASLNQGSSSDTIIDLQAKVKELEQMLDDCRADCDEEVATLQVKLTDISFLTRKLKQK